MPCWERTAAPLTAVCVTALAILLSACSSNLVLATWECKPANSSATAGSNTTDAGELLEFPWSTSFENGFCDYLAGGGYCYVTGAATYKVVTSPVHTGRYAAEYTAVSGGDNDSYNSRCFREGVLPQQAYYGAWYYIPALCTNSGVWNLFHFQGRNAPGESLRGLWDISLLNKDSGALRLEVYGFLTNPALPDQSDAPDIPIGEWFHIQMFLKRAADATGEVTVYQNGVSVFHVANLRTDNTTFGQWYVGNYATDLTPTISSLYVDDVSVGDAL